MNVSTHLSTMKIFFRANNLTDVLGSSDDAEEISQINLSPYLDTQIE